MSNIKILNFKEIDVNNIEFSNPLKVKGGSYVSVPKYENEPIYIQTPRLLNKGFNKTDQRCSLELELDNTHLSFYDFVTNVDDFNIIEIQKNSSVWFNQEFPLDVVEEFYKSPVRMARSKRAPSLRIKVPLSKGNIDCNIYNKNNKLINYTQVKENSKVLTVLHFYGLRFLKQQVICEWVPVQIKVFQDDDKGIQQSYIIDDSLLSDNEEVEVNTTDNVDSGQSVSLENDEDTISDTNVSTNEISDSQVSSEETPTELPEEITQEIPKEETSHVSIEDTQNEVST